MAIGDRPERAGQCAVIYVGAPLHDKPALSVSLRALHTVIELSFSLARLRPTPFTPPPSLQESADGLRRARRLRSLARKIPHEKPLEGQASWPLKELGVDTQ